jgi:hypothetical protein
MHNPRNCKTSPHELCKTEKKKQTTETRKVSARQKTLAEFGDKTEPMGETNITVTKLADYEVL